jgi:translation initiation factor eIF-2B subunit epsilon
LALNGVTKIFVVSARDPAPIKHEIERIK